MQAPALPRAFGPTTHTHPARQRQQEHQPYQHQSSLEQQQQERPPPEQQQQRKRQWQHIQRLLRERLDGRLIEAFRLQAHRKLDAQQEHDTSMLMRRVAAVWTDPTVPRCVAINDALPTCFDAPDLLVSAVVTLARHVPPAITLIFDETDTLVVPARDLYFAQRFRRLLPRMRQAVAAEDTEAMASLQESVESAIALVNLTTRHRILLSDDVAEVDCRGRLPLLWFARAILAGVRAYLNGSIPPTVAADAGIAPAPCTSCPGPSGEPWPRVFAAAILTSTAQVAVVGNVTYQRLGGIWVRHSPVPVQLDMPTAIERFAIDYCLWAGPAVVDARPLDDPVIRWADQLYRCVSIDGPCLWTIERALSDALLRCPPAYAMHGVFRAMLDCVGLVEASQRIRHGVTAPTILTHMTT
ncbi:hypothetical protein pneo_cds_843 [Pandoravirus neocaledonia]|uniref:Uncharacterized protein n=1 Tax=Pandoravirus neocaledonia TaxID=2107708 RepID=A0A2U7UDP5_9VIRU|nr:hypothetical protein pneo_cds_843 [Pandoravirus neocaledonia]AVK76450.1 hypothetical protein pneo_cds_843 [Pandoravirus neocaledonia]